MGRQQTRTINQWFVRQERKKEAMKVLLFILTAIIITVFALGVISLSEGADRRDRWDMDAIDVTETVDGEYVYVHVICNSNCGGESCVPNPWLSPWISPIAPDETNYVESARGCCWKRVAGRARCRTRYCRRR